MPKPLTDWTILSKVRTDWSLNPNFTNLVTLGDTSVRLNSTTVTLLGYQQGIHFYDQKKETDWTLI